MDKMTEQKESRVYEFIVKSNIKYPKNIRFNQKFKCTMEFDTYEAAESKLKQDFAHLPKIKGRKMLKDINIAKTLSENKRESISVQKRFSEDEIIGLKDELALASSKLKSVTADFKEISTDWKAQLKEIQPNVAEIVTSIEMKYETIERECFEMPDLDTGMILYVDCITGEVHESRNMTNIEKQLNFSQVNNMREAING